MFSEARFGECWADWGWPDGDLSAAIRLACWGSAEGDAQVLHGSRGEIEDLVIVEPAAGIGDAVGDGHLGAVVVGTEPDFGIAGQVEGSGEGGGGCWQGSREGVAARCSWSGAIVPGHGHLSGVGQKAEEDECFHWSFRHWLGAVTV